MQRDPFLSSDVLMVGRLTIYGVTDIFACINTKVVTFDIDCDFCI